MRIIISGEIRSAEGFKEEKHESGYKYGRYTVTEHSIKGVKIDDNRDGTFRADIDDITGKIPGQIPKETIVGFSIMSRLEGELRTRGIYRLGKAVGVVEGTESRRVDVNGEALEDVRDLYLKIRAGQILPEPKENWEAPQIPEPLKEPQKIEITRTESPSAVAEPARSGRKSFLARLRGILKI